MKAIVYTEYGAPDVLQVKDVEKPSLADNEILIRVYAVSVGYGDLAARNFKHMSFSEFNMPGPLLVLARFDFGWNKPKKQILGSEFSGVVEAVGSGVTRFRAGDPVFGYRGQSMGANVEFLSVAEDSLVTHKPANVTFEEAASIPYGALTALNLLRKVDIQRGQKVLVNGASGSIGSHAVQLAKHYGAEVTGVCGRPRVEFVRSLGADHVIDYTKEDFTKNGETYDVIFDILGKCSFSHCEGSLKPHGRLLYASFKTPHLLQMLRTSRSDGKKVICALSSENRDDLLKVQELIEAGAITSIVDQSFPIERAADAHRYVEQGHKKGHVVLDLAPAG
ncbi:MAG: NAD(P)-dependent alcohol dehydrogenase [Anaerolineaceae bacterium]|nr:NAD(P)-dependent alcohol dehydrogenase [Anaerolineaceae bacterium]